jgi:hypothetical protein
MYCTFLFPLSKSPSAYKNSIPRNQRKSPAEFSNRSKLEKLKNVVDFDQQKNQQRKENNRRYPFFVRSRLLGQETLTNA